MLATFISYQSDVCLSTLFKSFSLVVFQLRSGCLSDLIRITNDLLFVNNFLINFVDVSTSINCFKIATSL